MTPEMICPGFQVSDSTPAAPLRAAVATNALSLVPLVARGFDPAAKMEPLAKERERPPLRLFVGVVLPNQFLRSARRGGR